MPYNAVLLVTYLFPPIGGPGVQRNLKYVKYLPKFNWEPWVLTVKHINYHVYDSSLLREIRDESKVIRTGSLDPLRLTSFMAPPEKSIVGKQAVRNNRLSMTSLPVKLYRATRDLVTFPDPQVGWIPFAYYRGLEIIRENNIKAIVGAMEPISDTVVAYLLSRATGVPYLIDYRDSWTNDPHRPIPTRLHLRAHQALERRILKGASAVTVYDECMRSELEEGYSEVKGKIEVLPNGFDPADMDEIVPSPKNLERPFRIVYSGSLYNIYEPNLISLFAGLSELPESVRAQIEILFVGQSYREAQQLVENFRLNDVVQFLGYRPHSEALSYLLSADASLLLIEPGASTMITGKVFEYLMAEVPIFASIPLDGACAKLLRKAGFDDYTLPPDGHVEVREVLTRMIQCKGEMKRRHSVQQFSRICNTEKLALCLDSLVLSHALV